jgi:hypothetical protein
VTREAASQRALERVGTCLRMFVSEQVLPLPHKAVRGSDPETWPHRPLETHWSSPRRHKGHVHSWPRRPAARTVHFLCRLPHTHICTNSRTRTGAHARAQTDSHARSPRRAAGIAPPATGVATPSRPASAPAAHAVRCNTAAPSERRAHDRMPHQRTAPKQAWREQLRHRLHRRSSCGPHPSMESLPLASAASGDAAGPRGSAATRRRRVWVPAHLLQRKRAQCSGSLSASPAGATTPYDTAPTPHSAQDRLVLSAAAPASVVVGKRRKSAQPARDMQQVIQKHTRRQWTSRVFNVQTHPSILRTCRPYQDCMEYLVASSSTSRTRIGVGSLVSEQSLVHS